MLRERLEDLFTDWAGLIRIALDDAVAAGDIAPIDTAQAARALLTYIEGLSVMVRAAHDPDPVADLVPLAFRLIGAEPPSHDPARAGGREEHDMSTTMTSTDTSDRRRWFGLARSAPPSSWSSWTWRS